MPPRIILYDGVCGLCHGLVKFLLRVDKQHAFQYAPLQGNTAARLRETHSEIPNDLETMVFVEDGRVHLRSRAAFFAARYLGWPWKAFGVLRFLPAWLTDIGYWIVAKTRYRVFGRFDVCRVPTTEQRAVLLP